MLNKLYLSVENLILVCLFFLGFVKYFEIPGYGLVTLILKIFTALYIISNFKSINHSFKVVNFVLVLFFIWVFITSWLGRDSVSMYNPPLEAIKFFITMICFYFGLEVVIVKKGITSVIKTFTYCALAIIAVTDLFAFLDILVIYGQGLPVYLVGTKFQVMYFHLIFLALFLTEKEDMPEKRKWSFIITYSIFYILIALYVDCVTGIVGLILFIFMLCVVKKFPNQFASPKFLISIELAAFAYAFVGTIILANEKIYNFIENYMGGVGSMVARTKIYEKVLLLLLANPVFGYGYATVYEIGMTIDYFANTQNALLDWIWTGGIPAGLFVLILMYSVFCLVKESAAFSKAKNLYMVSLMYVYVLLGSIEIVMDELFFSVLGVIMIIAFSYKDKGIANCD